MKATTAIASGLLIAFLVLSPLAILIGSDTPTNAALANPAAATPTVTLVTSPTGIVTITVTSIATAFVAIVIRRKHIHSAGSISATDSGPPSIIFARTLSFSVQFKNTFTSLVAASLHALTKTQLGHLETTHSDCIRDATRLPHSLATVIATATVFKGPNRRIRQMFQTFQSSVLKAFHIHSLTNAILSTQTYVLAFATPPSP